MAMTTYSLRIRKLNQNIRTQANPLKMLMLAQFLEGKFEAESRGVT